jgi:hypothetical protein
VAIGVLQYPTVTVDAQDVCGSWGCEREGRLGALSMVGQEGRVFLLNFCFIRLTHLLSLYKEVYLTYKKDLFP